MQRTFIILSAMAFLAICSGRPETHVSKEGMHKQKRAYCTPEQLDKKKTKSCAQWKEQGYCESSNKYNKFMTKNCYATCFNCEVRPSPIKVRPSPIKVDAVACLKAHNDKRALHGSPPLAWDDKLTEDAQKWADHLAYDLGRMEHAKGTGQGENLFVGTARMRTFTCEQAIASWYKEIQFYDYNNPGFSMKTGHFTQVVWKKTSKLGMAVAVAKGDKVGILRTYIVARYLKAGNVKGGFEENVPKLL